MQVRVSGKQIDIGEALPEQVRERMENAIGKYFGGGAEANIVFRMKEHGSVRIALPILMLVW